MQYRELGRTGWKVSTVSFGAWAIGGTWGEVDDSESLAALHKAIDSGVNFISGAGGNDTLSGSNTLRSLTNPQSIAYAPSGSTGSGFVYVRDADGKIKKDAQGNNEMGPSPREKELATIK